MSPDDDASTISELPDGPPGPAARWATRAGVAFLVLIVLAGAFGLLGPTDGDAEADGGGYELAVTYPRVTRAGQPAPLHLTVTRLGGFDGPVRLALCDEFFDDLDFQNWYPNPSTEIGPPGSVVYEFDPPSGDTLAVSLDARTSPGQFGEVEECEVSVLDGGESVVGLTFDSWRMP